MHQAMVIWLVLWVVCYAFTRILCFVITYSVTNALVASNFIIYSDSCARTWDLSQLNHESNSWNKASIPPLTASFLGLPPLPVLTACGVWSKWWLHTQTLHVFYTIVLFLTIATPSICKIQKYWGWQTPGNEGRLAKQAIKKLGAGRALGWVGTKANNTRISRTITAKRLRFHFCFQFVA